MPKSLSELNLKDETLPTAGQALDDLPQFGQFTPPPQPGPMRFQLPKDLTRQWEPFENGDHQQRVSLIFDANSPLLIVQSAGGRYNNEPFQTRFNNNARARGKDKKMASDLDYLIVAVEGPTAKAPVNNRGYVEKINGYMGKVFGGDIRWSWKCSKDRNIRVKDAAGTLVEVENKKGCGEAYYQEQVDKQPGTGDYPLEIACKCGGILRAFGNVDNIRA